MPIYENEAVKAGAFLSVEGAIWMHPLDLIAMRTPNQFDRLDESMAWLAAKAHARLDAVKP